MRRKIHILRTRIKGEIVCEFLPPKKHSQKVIILCGGMPSYPGKPGVMEFLSSRGYWSFMLRYRGSWESDGRFLRKSPHKDVLDVVDRLPKGFKDLWSGKIYKIKNPVVYLIGGSFGGPAVILASKNERVAKVVALSPVVDWRKESKLEPIDWLGKFVKLAFGNGYRFEQKDWNKLKTGVFYNPMHEIRDIDGEKVLIFHAKDDKVVYFRPVRRFAEIIGCKLVTLKTGGHLSFSYLLLPKFWNKISAFFRK